MYSLPNLTFTSSYVLIFRLDHQYSLQIQDLGRICCGGGLEQHPVSIVRMAQVVTLYECTYSEVNSISEPAILCLISSGVKVSNSPGKYRLLQPRSIILILVMIKAVY
jgi:hypothetical protein